MRFVIGMILLWAFGWFIASAGVALFWSFEQLYKMVFIMGGI